MDAPDVTQLPQTGSVSAPDSGTYGIKAAADRLSQGMQPAPAPGGPTGAPAPTVSTMPGSATPEVPSGPFGLPAAITAPTQNPGQPVGTPMPVAVNPVENAQAANQKRLSFLDMLARNPDVSDATREWAQTVMSHLIQRTKQ